MRSPYSILFVIDDFDITITALMLSMPAVKINIIKRTNVSCRLIFDVTNRGIAYDMNIHCRNRCRLQACRLWLPPHYLHFKILEILREGIFFFVKLLFSKKYLKKYHFRKHDGQTLNSLILLLRLKPIQRSQWLIRLENNQKKKTVIVPTGCLQTKNTHGLMLMI